MITLGQRTGFAFGRFVYSSYDVGRLIVWPAPSSPTMQPPQGVPQVYERTCGPAVLGYFEYELDEDEQP